MTKFKKKRRYNCIYSNYIYIKFQILLNKVEDKKNISVTKSNKDLISTRKIVEIEKNVSDDIALYQWECILELPTITLKLGLP